MLNDHNDSLISVLETCWATSSTICWRVNTLKKKLISKLYLWHVNIHVLKFQNLMSTENLKSLKQLSRFILYGAQ